MIAKSISILTLLLVLVGCGAAEKAEETASESIAETVLEKTTGQSIDLENITSQEGKTEISIDFNGSSFMNKTMEAAPIQVMQDGMMVNASQEGQGGVTVQLIGKELFQGERPLRIATNMYKQASGEPVPTFNLMASKNEGEPQMLSLYSGEVVVEQLSAAEVLIRFEGEAFVKTGKNAFYETTAEMTKESAEGLQAVKGSIVCQRPALSFIGIEKSAVFQ